MNKIVNGVANDYEIPNVKSLLIDNERKQIIDIYNEENHSVITTKLYSLEKQIEEKDKEIDRLNNIIDKAKKETTKQLKGAITQEFTDLEKILNILELKEGNK